MVNVSRLAPGIGAWLLVLSIAPVTASAGSYVATTQLSFTGTQVEYPDSLTPDGKGGFVGTTQGGTIFDFSPATNSVTRMATVGGDVVGGLVPAAPGVFYGTTYTGGTMGEGSIFRFTLATHAVSNLVNFTGPNGENPNGPLVADGQGNYLGTTSFGGSSSKGTVFSFNPATDVLTTLASFNGANGAVPQSGLVPDGQGHYLGTTHQGGTANEGTVFSFNPASGAISALASFTGLNGADPYAGLVPDGRGGFLGTTPFGGPSDKGTIFAFDPATSALTTLVNFNNANGATAYAGLVPDGRGSFLGTTVAGLEGDVAVGKLFSLDPATGDLTTLTNFVNTFQSEPVSGLIGSDPSSPLVSDGQGDFFGTTARGGTQGLGTIYEISAVPEPRSLILAGSGALVLVASRLISHARRRIGM
jgi:uncharacterized repeat protein (TIGR03803 family)